MQAKRLQDQLTIGWFFRPDFNPGVNFSKIPVISSGLIQFRKGFLVSNRKIFRQGSLFFFAIAVWLHVNNYCKGAVTCVHQKGGISGIMFCHQTSGPISGGAYKWEGL